MGAFIVGAIIVAIVGTAIFSIYRSKKKGGCCGCEGGCGGCGDKEDKCDCSN